VLLHLMRVALQVLLLCLYLLGRFAEMLAEPLHDTVAMFALPFSSAPERLLDHYCTSLQDPCVVEVYCMHSGRVEESAGGINQGEGEPSAVDANKPCQPQGMLDKCSEQSGWFPRGAWEAASQQISRMVCDLLPPSFSGAQKTGARDGSQSKLHGGLRLGSLPAKATPPPQKDPSTSDAAHRQGGSQQDTVMHSIDELQEQGAHNLLPTASAGKAAALMVNEEAGTSGADQPVSWREAFKQITRQLHV
jgi:hypothetical protein